MFNFWIVGSFLAMALSGLIIVPAHSEQSSKLSRLRSDKPADAKEFIGFGSSNQSMVGDAEQYKLAFASSFNGSVNKGIPSGVSSSSTESFVKELNRISSVGYKTVSVVGVFPFALLKRDPFSYDYILLKESGPFWQKAGFLAGFTHFSNQGFRLVSEFRDSRDCEDMTPDQAGSYPLCIDTDMYLAERQMGVNQTRGDELLDVSGPTLKEKTANVLNAYMDQRLTEGYYPQFLVSKFEVLLERPTNAQSKLGESSDLLIVASGSRDDLWKEVNEKGIQGYRLEMVNNKIALLNRDRANPKQTSYICLDTFEKNFESQLGELQREGAIYRMSYPDDKGVRSKLIFEKRPDGDNNRRDYKVLRLELTFAADKDGKHVLVDLTQNSKEKMKELNEMANNGYVAADLFRDASGAKSYSVLMMRSQ